MILMVIGIVWNNALLSRLTMGPEIEDLQKMKTMKMVQMDSQGLTLVPNVIQELRQVLVYL